MDSITNAQKLLREVTYLIGNSEYGVVELGGVRNISRSDLETIGLYVGVFLDNSGMGFTGLMDPVGEVKEVLDAYGVVPMMKGGW